MLAKRSSFAQVDILISASQVAILPWNLLQCTAARCVHDDDSSMMCVQVPKVLQVPQVCVSFPGGTLVQPNWLSL